jgi:signal transduction histidine kinase
MDDYRKSIVDFSEVNKEIFENAAVIMALVDDQGRVVNLNKPGVAMVGKEKVDLLNKAGGEVFNCSNAWSRGKMVCGIGKNCAKCAVRNTVMNTFETGDSIYKKEGYLDVDTGSKIVRLQLLLSAALVTITQQKFVLLTIEDITDLKNKEAKLREAIATKEKFFSVLYNDLRGPISSVIAFTELACEDISNNGPDDCQQNLALIHEEMEHAFKLLENLLLWSRNQKGQIKISPTLLQARKSVNDIIALFGNLLEVKSIEVKNNIPEDIIIKLDKDMFSAVMRNLLSNAIKFSKSESIIKINATKRHDEIEFSIVDQGIGMSEEEQSQLFNLSKEVTKRGTANEKGTGIGLILCREFIEKHKGKLWVESEAHKGTTVYFKLPRLIKYREAQSLFIE